MKRVRIQQPRIRRGRSWLHHLTVAMISAASPGSIRHRKASIC